MSETGICPNCGGELPRVGSSEDLCPKCLLEIGLDQPTATLEYRGASALSGRFSAERGAGTDYLVPGTIVAQRYQIIDFIGRGGMGVVYRAHDQKLDHLVALKLLPESLQQDEGRVSRLLGEVRIARQVSHPNVCRVHDIGEMKGIYCLSMELIQGRDLASILEAGRVRPDSALVIAKQICAGLAAAHEKGVLHRDLKPANVMVSDDGVAQITDFGLAHLLRDPTSPAAFEGTPQYMSPEQLAGESVTIESDIYALGLVLYELFTGYLAFKGRSREELLEEHARRLEAPSSLAPELDPEIERVILRCLDDNPAKRPPSASAVGEALPGDSTFAEAMAAAQRRADRIAQFRSELVELQRVGVLEINDSQRAALEQYHRGVLREYVERFDIDTTERGKQLSLGTRIASFLGALAFSASVFYFFYRFWGLLATPAQLIILVSAPVIALIGSEYIKRRERSGYYSLLTASLALSCLVLNVTVFRRIFNMAPSELDLLVWGLFGLTLAYSYGHRLLLWFGLLGLAGFANASMIGWTGVRWSACFLRPENYLAAGLVIFALSVLLPHRDHPQFPTIYRLFGLLYFLIPVFVLANWGGSSYLALNPETIEIGYQILGFGVCAAAIWIGIAHGWRETVNIGTSFFVVFLYSKYVDWWWQWMPKYVFFFVVGLTALGVLILLRRYRSVLNPTFRET